MAVIGPGAVQETPSDIKPTLDGASEYEYVEVLNPLSDDFQVRVAQDIPVNMPLQIRSGTQTVSSENDIRSVYGLNLKNTDHQARKQIFNDTVIPSGKTKRFTGNEAQVVVRQLVNEIMQREGKSRLLADPVQRQEIEQRIIISRGSMADLMTGGISPVSQQLQDAVTKSNEVEDEPFPTLNRTEETTTVGDTGAGSKEGAVPDRTPTPEKPETSSRSRTGSVK